MAKFSQYMKEGVEKHPELDTTKRSQELKAEGKSDEEIKDIIIAENPKVKAVLEIIKDNPEYLKMVDGPRLVIKALEERLAKKPTDIKDTEKEELRAIVERLEKEKADIEAELRRRDGIDSDTRSSRRSETSTNKLSETDEAQEKIRRMAGISKERLEFNKERRAKLVGIGTKDDDE